MPGDLFAWLSALIAGAAAPRSHDPLRDHDERP
jgi:hypothetical protein